tara:strand:+ start:42 stop:257 length:216 start_codon:yes stop_codon:yes gene_type:complete
MTSIKEIFESDNWIITKVIESKDSFRVDAHRRFLKPNEINLISQWRSKKYVNSLCVEHYGKKANELNCYQY